MITRHIKVGIKSWTDNKRELAEVFRKVGRGKRPVPEEALHFADVATFRRCLTPQRLELLWVAAEQRPQSVDDLVTLLGRDATAVGADLDYLASVGLIELRPSRTRKGVRAPVVPYDRVDLSVELRNRAA